jgi:nicotinamidase-related amidase
MKALLIVDMLNDFVKPGAPLEVPGARNIVPALRRELENARSSGVPVFYLCDAHDENDPEFSIWPRHAVKGSAGAEVIEELSPRPGEKIVQKTSYSGFFGTDLESLLRSAGVDALVITGVVTNICVLYTAVDALMRGFDVEIPDDCVAALNENDHRFALKQIREVLKPRKT